MFGFDINSLVKIRTKDSFEYEGKFKGERNGFITIVEKGTEQYISIPRENINWIKLK